MAGDSMLYFALGWAASAHGGAMAAAVLTAISLPRASLLLFGGAVADRVGPHRVMIIGDTAMCLVSLLLATGAYFLGAPPWLLLATGVAIGVADAFCLPASGSMPRRLVSDDRLPRALALRQMGGQMITMAGGPLGGVLVGLAGLTGAALVNATTFGVVLLMLLAIRPRRRMPAAPTGTSLLQEAVAGVRFGLGHPILRPGLTLIGAAAGFLLPVMPLLLPLLAREQHWAAGATGLVVGAQGVGVVAVTFTVVRRGPLGRPGLLSAGGLTVAGVAALGLAMADSVPTAAGAGLVMGVGNGLFTAHISPLLVAVVPQAYLSRVQALLTLVQSVSLLAMNNVLGTIATVSGVTVAIVVCAVATTGTGLLGLLSTPLRTSGLSATAA